MERERVEESGVCASLALSPRSARAAGPARDAPRVLPRGRREDLAHLSSTLTPHHPSFLSLSIPFHSFSQKTHATDTKVRYAEQQCTRSPVSMASSSTRTPTSAEDLNTRFTWAAVMVTAPRRAGLKKWTASTDAVTTGPRASVLAASPAATSIQDRTMPA